MKTLIIYDSVFGNTEQIALAISQSIGIKENVESFRVSDIKLEQLNGLSLLIIGSPTRAFNPTKPMTRFLNSISSNGLKGVKVTAFDTRLNTKDVKSRMLNSLVKVFGYAAKPIADKLVKKGGKLIIPPEGFFVKESEGPLKEAELERAMDWALAIKAQLTD